MKKHSLLKCLLVAMCLPMVQVYAQQKAVKNQIGNKQQTAAPTNAGTGGKQVAPVGKAANTNTAVAAVRRTPVETFIERIKDNNKLVPVTNIWQPDNQYDQRVLRQSVAQVQPLTIDYSAVADLIKKNTTAISLVVPGAGGVTYTIDLAQYNCMTNDFKVITNANGKEQTIDYTPGKYYSGVVRGVKGSVAAFSFFNGEVYGVFSMPGVGNMVLMPNTVATKVTGYNQSYLLYNDKDLTIKEHAPKCASDVLNASYTGEAYRTTTTLNNSAYQNCREIRTMMVADYALYLTRGSSPTNVANYMTALFNNQAILYRNESIIMDFKVLQINTTSDEYQTVAVNSSLAFLKLFGGVVQNTFKATHGCDLAMLISTARNAGFGQLGGVAWRPALCFNYNPADSSGPYGYANMDNSSITSFPTYSWDVEVVCHEIGHILGSNHTHACAWNGNNTGIDGCYTMEGGCADPGDPSPVVGGTIMSYCHLTGTGINFANGFGPQPGDFIRNWINTRSTGCGAQYTPSIALAIPARTVTANRECTDLTSGRTYYWSDNSTASQDDDTLVLIIAKGVNSIGDLNSGLVVTANTVAGYGTGAGQAVAFPSGTSGVLAQNTSMRRYWKISGASTPASDVEVLYPFLAADTTDIKGSVAASAMPNYRMYKVNSPIEPNPALGFSGGVAGDFSVYTFGISPSATNWALTSIGSTLLARMNVSNVNGGGTAFFSEAGGSISGNTTVCVLATTQLSNSSAGGVWSTPNTTIATIDAGGLVTGVSGGTATISYTIGGTPTTVVVTVTPAPGTFGGATTVCVGSSIVLSNAVTGGVWSSTNSSVATVNNASRTVFGRSAGTVDIRYSNGCGADGLQEITVIAAPTTIQGPATVCVGAMIFMSNAVTGGAWSASTTHVSVSTTTGDVLGLTAGTTAIRYSTGCGTMATKTVTVKAEPGAITGPTIICEGAIAMLGNAVGGGTWTSTIVGVAMINPATGVLTGTTAGITDIIYSTGCGDDAIVSVTVSPGAGVITGPGSVCVGATIFMSAAAGGGMWSSSNGNAIIPPTSNDVLGVSQGVVVISYNTVCGAAATHTITVVDVPGVMGGTDALCAGTMIVVGNIAAGGTWSSGDIAIATVDEYTGLVYGVAAGTTSLNYSTGCGSPAVQHIEVLEIPGQIEGVLTVMAGATTQLSNSSMPDGTWTSGAPAKATIDAVTGLATGVSTGISVMAYTLDNGCYSQALLTVTSSFVDGYSVCTGQTITMNDGGNPGGTWTSGNGSIATVGSASGVVTGAAAGTVVMYYNHPGGLLTSTVTVRALSATTGASAICGGQSTTLTNTTPGGGVWSSDNTEIAAVSAGGVVSGTGPGTATIMFAANNGCVTTKVVNVTGSGSIDGPTSVCAGQTITLSNGSAGGAWSSSSGATATVNAAGVVSGLSAGTVRISYILGGGCLSVSTITVRALYATTGGTTAICENATMTLANSTPGGGVWSSSNTDVATVGVTGVVRGTGGGMATILFTTNTGGCVASKTVTINAAPEVTGDMAVCSGQKTQLSNGGATGVWSSSSAAVVAVTSGGLVTGAAAGTARITFIATGGCIGSNTVTVSALTQTTGLAAVCQGRTITLANTTPGGGAWSTNNSAIATVTGAGVVSGAGAGSAVISFSANNGCVATKTVSVNGTGALSGTMTVCVGQSTNISTDLAGGNWSSSSGALATVSAAGVILGVNAGSPRISYIWPTGCQAIATLTVRPLSAITGGTSGMCQSGSMTLANITPGGGVWSSSNTSIATVNGSGVVRGAGVGAVNILFTTSLGCVGSRAVTVNACRESGSSATGVVEAAVVYDLQLYPNPNKGTFSLTGSVNEDGAAEVAMEIINTLGQVVYQGTAKLTEGKLNERVEMSNMASGNYLLRVRTEQSSKVFRFVVGQ